MVVLCCFDVLCVFLVVLCVFSDFVFTDEVGLLLVHVDLGGFVQVVEAELSVTGQIVVDV